MKDFIGILAYTISFMVIVMLVMTGLWALMDSSTCNQWAALNPDHNIQWKLTLIERK
jgi:hypothetical protein